MNFLMSVTEPLPNDRDRKLDTYIQLIAEGSRDALASLYHHTRTSIYAFALSVLRDPHDAEDVLQDTYLSIHSSAAGYRSAGKPMAWILTIAKNLCLMRLREQKRTVSIDAEDWDRYLEASCEMNADDRIILTQCMSRLSQEEQQIITLHTVAGFKHREIAQFLGMPLATVLSKYHRGLKKLRAYL